MRRYLLRRFVWTIVLGYLLLSAAFFLFAYTPDPNEVVVAWGAGLGADDPAAAQQAAVAAYRDARNYDEPVLDRYRTWIVNYATFNWGWSVTHGESVRSLIADRAPITLTYVIPALLLSIVVGVALGLYAAFHRHGLIDAVLTSFSYVGLGVPSFFLAELLVALAFNEFGWYGALWDDRYGLWTTQNLTALALPAIVVAANLLAVQVRYARAESLEHLPTDFVKRLRAGGTAERRVARHVLRNAAFPIVSLLFTEVLTVLFVTIYVLEVVFKIPGVGKLAYDAIVHRDIGIILATTLLPAYISLAGSLVQDVAYTVLDPRVGYDD